MKGLLICFTGMDGAGKTTLANFLVGYLIERGVNARYVYNRYTPILMRPIIKIGGFLFLRNKSFFGDYSEYSETKRRASKKHPYLARAYQVLLLLDYFFQIFFKVKLPLLLGRKIVCDRYIYDTIITDLSVDFDYSKEEVKELLDRIFLFFPRPHITFLVDVPEEIAFQRKDDIPSVDYLKERREKYLYLAEEYGMVIIDGSLPPVEVERDVERGVEGVIAWVK